MHIIHVVTVTGTNIHGLIIAMRATYIFMCIQDTQVLMSPDNPKHNQSLCHLCQEDMGLQNVKDINTACVSWSPY